MTRLVGELVDGDPAIDALNARLLALYQEVLGNNSVLFQVYAAACVGQQSKACTGASSPTNPAGLPCPYQSNRCQPHPAPWSAPTGVTCSKPDPEPMLLACQQCGCEPSEAIYFGDHARDIEAGRAAGMLTVACEWGYIDPSENTDCWNADFRLRSAEEIPALPTTLTA
ncbi:MAG: HAD-IA family hydrolase [Pseudomonadales bacterium]